MERSSASLQLLLILILLSTSAAGNVSLESSGADAQGDEANSLHILAVMSVQDGSGDGSSTIWSHGKDILKGAFLAAQDINNYPMFLDEFKVEVVPIQVPDCDPVRAIDQLVEKLMTSSLNIVGATGMFCDKVAEVYSPLIGHQGSDLIQIIGSSISHGREKRGITQPELLFHVLPSHEDLAEAVISLLYRLNWMRIGIVHFGGTTFMNSN